MFFKRKSQENKVLDDLEMDKDFRFRLMLEHGSDWTKYYVREIRKDVLKCILNSIKDEKENRK